MTMVRRAIPIAVVAFLAALSPGGADAQDQQGFRMPSNNIYCIIEAPFEGQPAPDLRCDVQHMSSRPPAPPRDCPLSWGDAFSITPNGLSGKRICHGDTTRNDELMVLPYGGEWRQSGFSCRSDISGLTCLNLRGHGFMLSRAVQRIF